MHALRRRLAVEDGMSLVEMIVAIFIITVALFALLGGMVAVAQSTHDQRMRTSATRIATATVENLRAVGFEDLEPTAEVSEPVVTPDGRSFTVTREVTEVDAHLVDGSGDDLKQIRVVVSWDTRNGTKQAEYATLVAAKERPPTVTGRIAAEMSPNPVSVQGAHEGYPGAPIQPVRLTAVFDYDFDGDPMMSWTDRGANGELKQVALSPPDEDMDARIWTYEFPTTCTASSMTCLHYPIDEGDTNEDGWFINVTVTGGHLSTLATLHLQPRPENPPVFGTVTVTNPISVESQQGQCRGAQQCVNRNVVNINATVTGMLNDARVIVRYQVRDSGTVGFREVSLSRSDSNPNNWTYSFPMGSEKFRPGSPQSAPVDFDFVALHVLDDGTEVAVTHRVPVLVQEPG